MPISANLQDAIQTKFQNSIRALAKEAKGGKLRGLAEKAIGKGNIDVVFYRSEEGTVFTGELNMYDSAWASTDGKIIKKTAIIDYIYWSHKIKQKELNSTDLSPVAITFLGNQTTGFTAKAGDTIQLAASVAPDTAKDGVKWSVDNESVIKIDDKGLVTGVGSGNATITLECYGKTATCQVIIR